MRRRGIIQFGGVGVCLAIAGCLGNNDENEEREVVEDPDPQSFNGEGDAVIDDLQNEGGFFAVEYGHEGDGDFTVELYSEEASHSHVIVDDHGAVEGRWAEGTYDANYAITVDAAGEWQLRIEQPRPSSEEVFSLPASLTGERPDYAGPYEFNGQVTISATYSGDDRFVARVLDSNGNPYPPLFDREGSFEGEMTETYEHPGWIHVEAADKWTLDIN